MHFADDSQTYQNQFQKYEPQPFVEQDIEPTVVSEDGPLIAPATCRAAFKRSIGKIFYHAGFEDFQPSALESITDVATEYFKRLVGTFKTYRESSKGEDCSTRFTFEEQVLHALDENGTDLESLETYVTDDVDRLGTKLGVMHERMTAHLKELIVGLVFLSQLFGPTANNVTASCPRRPSRCRRRWRLQRRKRAVPRRRLRRRSR